ncbi:MAG: ADP-ribose pyrophosphatase [Blastocatellia bacterium]|jgi:8-oxo-dGTP pyrophosphatase MutT (NUDIX family)|nr:ADP-ribose pyrophosphatase [Blastocatellia bacterium]
MEDVSEADVEETNDAHESVRFARERFGAETFPWRRVASEQLADCRVFQVRRDHSISARDEREHDFYVIEATDWINIIPLTAHDDVVMIEQYRHGIGEATLEIPGGMVDEGEGPQDAALREMLEETGYAGREALLLGKTRPNPAIQNNWIHTFLARDVRFQRAPVFDSTEHTTVRLVPLAHVPALIADGTITHSLVVAGFYWLSLYQSNLLSK